MIAILVLKEEIEIIVSRVRADKEATLDEKTIRISFNKEIKELESAIRLLEKGEKNGIL